MEFEDPHRPYLTGSDVMATWKRFGFVPPSEDPVYIKKWIDFRRNMLQDSIDLIASKERVVDQ